MTGIETVNRSVFLFLNAGPETPEWMVDAARILAADLVFAVPLILAFLWFWGADLQRNTVLKAVIVTGVSLGVSWLIGRLWPHPRPFMLDLGQTYLSHAPDTSFPSDHATFFFAIGFTLIRRETKRLGLAVVLGGIAAGWARVFLGIHFPLDILGGTVVGAAVLGCITPLWRIAGERGTASVILLYRFVLAPLISRGWIRR